MKNHATRAVELFFEGFNCAQSVLGAFAEDPDIGLGMDFKTAVRAASGLGGGLSRQRELCGAVNGMCIAASLLLGYDKAEDTEGKKRLYADIQRLCAEFRSVNGSIICRDLLGTRKGQDTSPAPDTRTAEYYRSRPCAKMIYDAAKILDDELARRAAEGSKMP
ncbi:MAG: C_GCAxxG_C_C family protein [Butyricicoccus sp.]|nr:C_GCAxxG_C_C family protein [Butyricicoccus sp.]